MGAKSVYRILTVILLLVGFQLNSQAQSPGGVSINLTLWLKADKDATVSQWNDQSTKAYHVTQATTANQPILNTTTGLVNFNPNFTFTSASSQFFSKTSGITTFTNPTEDMFAVANTDKSSANYTLSWSAPTGNTFERSYGYNNNGNAVTTTNGSNIINSASSVGSWVVNNGAFTIGGTVSSSGTITSTAGTVKMSGGAAQVIAANLFAFNQLAGLVITNSSGVSLQGTLTLTDSLAFGNINNSTFNTGGYLILKSDLTTLKTARIADITNNSVNSGNVISGEVTVERYMTSYNNRAWRLITPSVTSITSVHANWQEGAIARWHNPNPGYGTHISGPVSTDQQNGFDYTQSRSNSLYKFVNQSMVAVSNTNTELFNALTPYYIFIRGDRTYNLDQPQPILPADNTSLNTVLRAKGAVLQNNQVFSNLNSGLSGGLPAAGVESIVVNPYASPLNWASVYADNNTSFENYYNFYDPNISTTGGFVTVNSSGIKSDQSSNATVHIQSGTAFIVTTKSGVVSPSLTVRERHKSVVSNTDVYRSMSEPSILYSSLYYYDVERAAMRKADGVASIFSDSYSEDVDGDDAIQSSNSNEDISLKRGGYLLSIESRPVRVALPDTLFINITGMKTQSYEWRLDLQSMTGLYSSAYLYDKFTGIQTLVDLNASQSIVSFSCTSDAASKAAGRFYIVLNPLSALPLSDISIEATQKGTAVSVEWQMRDEQTVAGYEVEKSINGRNFKKFGVSTASGSNIYGLLDNQPIQGANFYRVKVILKTGASYYSKVAKVVLSSGTPMITLYPNPVTGNSVMLQLTDIAAGTYTVNITNSAGQVVYKTTLQHTGGSALKTISFGNKLSQGVYEVMISDYVLRLVKQ